MMNQLLKRIAVSSVLVLCLTGLTAPAVSARERYRTEVENHVEIGDINIRLDEFERDKNGKLVPYTGEKTVLPGETVSKIARVTNLANDAWIRIKVNFESDSGMTGVDASMLTLAEKDWLERGRYYYWPYEVSFGETIDFLDAVRIPAEWDSSFAKKKFRIVISADAVQSRNFTPDFEADDPWFGTVIEQCVHEEHSEDTDEGSSLFRVEFRGGAEGLVRVGDDFFSNWAELMPGDIRSDTAVIRNRYNETVKIWFRSENVQDIGEDILIGKLLLTIKNGDTVLYEGPLSGTTEPVSLGEYKKGEGGTLSYTLYVPPELNNRFALTKTLTKWVFECELVPGQSGEGAPPGTPEIIKTGDFSPVVPYLLLFAVSAAGPAVLCRKRRKS